MSVAWFARKKLSEEDKEKAASIFADRDKKPVEAQHDPGVAQRMFKYNEIKSETLSEEQRRAERLQAREDSKQAESAIANFTGNRKNDSVYGLKVEAREKLTDEERKSLEQKGMDRFREIDDRLKNKGFMTQVVPESKTVNETLSADEILAATKKIRNEGYFTEVKTTQKALTEEQKAKRDAEDLKSAEKAIASLMGASFYARKGPETDETGEDGNDENEGGN